MKSVIEQLAKNISTLTNDLLGDKAFTRFVALLELRFIFFGRRSNATALLNSVV